MIDWIRLAGALALAAAYAVTSAAAADGRSTAPENACFAMGKGTAGDVVPRFSCRLVKVRD